MIVLTTRSSFATLLTLGEINLELLASFEAVGGNIGKSATNPRDGFSMFVVATK